MVGLIVAFFLTGVVWLLNMVLEERKDISVFTNLGCMIGFLLISFAIALHTPDVEEHSHSVDGHVVYADDVE